MQTDQKSNEITAIPRLLELLDAEGAVVTIDAMGCQKEIARQIVGQGGDHVLRLKGNQGTLNDDVRMFFDEAEKNGFEQVPHAYAETVDGDHGRMETRRIWCTGEVAWFQERERWQGLRSFGMVEAVRELGGKVSKEKRYFINSLPGDDAVRFGEVVRQHWGVENSLHWALDISFREDECRVRTGHGAENFSVLRRIALNLPKKDRTLKVGIENKRLRAGWDNDYLLKVLLG